MRAGLTIHRLARAAFAALGWLAGLGVGMMPRDAREAVILNLRARLDEGGSAYWRWAAPLVVLGVGWLAVLGLVVLAVLEVFGVWAW